MANFLKSIMDSLKLQDDDDDYDEYEAEERERVQKERVSSRGGDSSDRGRSTTGVQNIQETMKPQQQKTGSAVNYTYIENRNSGSKAIRMERPEGNKVIPISTTRRGLEVCVMKPRSFEDSQDICDVLLSGRAAIVNLEGFDIELGQRIMDFISGALYSMNGKLYQISGFIFIVTPESVDITGDYNELIAQSGFEVPILSKDF